MKVDDRDITGATINSESVTKQLKGPSGTYLMGTDLLGRDSFSRLMLGIGQSFTIAFSSVALATLAGTSTPGEVLEVKLRAEPEGVRLTVALPTLLAQRDEAGLFSAAVGKLGVKRAADP